MKILTLSTLYPNNNEPKHGIFVRNRLLHLLNDFPDVQATVVAPVPWFPSWLCLGPLKQYKKFAGVKAVEQRDGLTIYHPRYLVLPKIGMNITPYFLTRACIRQCQALVKSGQHFDLIDGHYFYPDGVAIAKTASALSLPFTITARGTDINLIPQFPTAREKIIAVAKQAGRIFTVCKALADELLTFLPDVAAKTHVLRNGVDLNFFTPSPAADRDTTRQQWLPCPEKSLVVSVGHLIERKGHHLVIDAIASLPDAYLVIAGDGEKASNLQLQVQRLGLADRVKFAGALAQNQLKTLYQSADALVLASSREGWANVLLESMACGTPVVATNLWGTPEVVASPEAGVLVERSVEGIATGIQQLLANLPDRNATRRYAEQFSWQETSNGQYQHFAQLIEDAKRKCA